MRVLSFVGLIRAYLASEMREVAPISTLIAHDPVVRIMGRRAGCANTLPESRWSGRKWPFAGALPWRSTGALQGRHLAVKSFPRD